MASLFEQFSAGIDSHFLVKRSFTKMFAVSKYVYSS